MMAMTWFGRDYGAPIYKECREIPVPSGISCVRCLEMVRRGDDGFIDSGGSCFHRACFLRLIYGSIAHQTKLCSCYRPGADCDELVGVTVRQEAEQAVAFYESRPGPGMVQ